MTGQPIPPNRTPFRCYKGFVRWTQLADGVADLVILHHLEMFDLFVTPMLQTQTNEVGFEPTEIKKQLASGLFFVCVLGVLGIFRGSLGGYMYRLTKHVQESGPSGVNMEWISALQDKQKEQESRSTFQQTVSFQSPELLGWFRLVEFTPCKLNIAWNSAKGSKKKVVFLCHYFWSPRC